MITVNKQNLNNSLKEYCNYFDLPIEHIVEIISDLKVIPMLRGKGFEFTVADCLRSTLSQDWDVDNPNINAQSEVHDVDVFVIRKKDNKRIKIECKLSGKNSFANDDSGNIIFKVKCMRSRTISDNEMATRMAKKYSVERKQILFHADNYREIDFDYVITSMGNAFWTTKNKKYIFECKKEDINSLSKLFPNRFGNVKNKDDFRKKVYNFLLIARSKDITVSTKNNIIDN